MLTLSKLKQYMQQNKTATMQGLVITYHAPPETIETLMEHLIQRKLVEACDECIAQCGTKCGSCHLSTVKVYNWVDAARLTT